MVERTTGSRGIRKRSNRFLAPEQVPPVHCDFCDRNISRKIRIKCAECVDFDLCVGCFAVGVEVQEHKKNHRYRVIDDQSFAVFSSNWRADEELLFFDGICDFGISNWEAVGNFIGSKSAKACEQHYIELLEKQHWLDDELPPAEPLTTKDVKEAFPFDFKSDELGNSPRSLSPVSSANLSVSSMSLGELSEMQDWTTADSVETDQSSLDGDAVMGFNEADGIFTEMDGALEEPKEAVRQLPTTASISQLSPHLQENGLDVGNSVESSIKDTILPSNEHNAYASHAVRDMPSSEKRQPEFPAQRTVSTPGALLPSKTLPGGRAERSLSLFDNNAGDVTGYNPSRREFDPPFDIGAEQMIADLEFLDDDPEEVTRAKLKLLQLYRWRIHERERRTGILKRNAFGLLDVRKIIAMERSWNANERFSDLRPFARYSSLDKVERLARGLCFEQTLRRRIAELQEARAIGCRSFGEIRARSKDLKSSRPTERTSAQLIGKWRRCLPDISESSLTLHALPELNSQEKVFCSDVGFSHWQYAVLRDRILREAEEHAGRFPKAHVRSFFRLDSTQAVKLFDFLVTEGKLINSDKDNKDNKKQPSTDNPPPDAVPHSPTEAMDIDTQASGV